MKLAYVFLALAVLVVGVVATAGLRGHHFTGPPFEIFPDMNYQDKVKDQQPSAFFADGNSAREPVPGTVALEMPALNDYWATGKSDDTHWGNGIPTHEARDGRRPLAVDDADMARGRERYNISCAACHGAAGDGQGIVTKYGLTGVANYHTDLLRQASDGDIFNTISNGKGQMLGYGYNVTIDDRWRIVMYVRALQRSQNAPLSDATPSEQVQLEKTKKPPQPAPPPPAPTTPAGLPAANPTQAPGISPPVAPHSAQPTGPTAPSGNGTPSPSTNPTNLPPAQEPGSASLDLSPSVYPHHTVPPTLISDLGTVVEPTYFADFVPVTPPGLASKRITSSPKFYWSPKSHPTHPVKFLSQQTLKGWYDDIDIP